MVKRDSLRPWLVALSIAMLVAASGCAPDAPTGAANPGDSERASVQAGGAQSSGAEPTGAEATGARIYNGNCIPCHGPDGRGLPGVFPSLSGSPVVQGDPESLARWVLKGQRAASMPAGRYAAAEMPSFAWMKPADAAALFTYVRASFGNSASPVAVSAVEAAVSK